jgi:hypothetical protein
LRKNPIALYLESEYDLHAWHPIRWGFEGNTMRLHGHRYFTETNDTRDYKLGSVRTWTVGFYDHKTNAGAWSEDMELILENGSPVANALSVEQIIVPDEYEVNQGNYSAKYNFEGIGPSQCNNNPKCEGWEVNGYYKV